MQLGTVRVLGTFLVNPTEVPAEVAATLAQQIGVVDPACLGRYCDGKARWHHAAKIRHVYGYRESAEPAAQWRLLRWLYALCWTGTARPPALFDRATARLVAHKVLLPGASVLERTIARVRAINCARKDSTSRRRATASCVWRHTGPARPRGGNRLRIAVVRDKPR